MDNSDNTDTIGITEQESLEKQTNRVFTQSEVDKLIANTVKKKLEEIGDVKAMQEQLAQLEKEKKERELAEMSEIEKYKVKMSELESLALEKEKALNQYKQKSTLAELMSDPKYSKMPKAYKNLVVYSENPEELIKSAENALAEYTADIGGGIKETFGIPNTQAGNPAKTARQIIRGAGDMQGVLKAQIAEKLMRK